MHFISKTIAALFCLVLAVSPACSGSMMLLGVGKTGGGGCSQATTFLARTSGLSGTETTAYTNLICGLVTDGIITGTMSGANSGAGACGSTLDALYILATNTTTTAALNLCGTSYSLLTTATITFSADHGYTGDGTTGFLDTQFNPSTATTPNFAQNSASIGAYVLNSRTTGNTGASIGSGVTAFAYLVPLNGGTQIEYGINDNSFPAVANANAQGFLISTRTASNLTSVYRNGNTTAVGTAANASVNVPTASETISAINQGGKTNFSSDQIAAAFIGTGLSSANMALISNRVNAYMTALAINVY